MILGESSKNDTATLSLLENISWYRVYFLTIGSIGETILDELSNNKTVLPINTCVKFLVDIFRLFALYLLHTQLREIILCGYFLYVAH